MTSMMRVWMAMGLVWLGVSPLAHAEDDSKAADRCRRLLESSVIDFYLPHCIDQEHGGYLEVIDGNGKFVGSEKFLTLQARQLWFFSTLAVADIRRYGITGSGEAWLRIPHETFSRSGARRILHQDDARRNPNRPPQTRLPECLCDLRPGGVPPGQWREGAT